MYVEGKQGKSNTKSGENVILHLEMCYNYMFVYSSMYI